MSADSRFDREKNLIGERAFSAISGRTVAVFGLGGVGSYCVEALARGGVGKLVLCDKDVVDITNVNRQLYALTSTVGMSKCDVAKERVKDINPDCEVVTKEVFFDEKTLPQFDFSAYDYVVDCIDTVTSKLLLIKTAKAYGTKIIACLGTGNKLDPTRFKVDDISKTSVCPLAKVMRQRLKKEEIDSLKVLYSDEAPIEPKYGDKRTPSSISFVPPVAGLIIAGEVIKDLMKGENDE